MIRDLLAHALLSAALSAATPEWCRWLLDTCVRIAPPVETVEQLSALPPASVVIDLEENVYQVDTAREWGQLDNNGVWLFSDAELLAHAHKPIRVIYTAQEIS